MRVRAIWQRGAFGLIAWLAAALTAPAQESDSQPASQPAAQPPSTAPTSTSAPAQPRVALDIACAGQDWGRIVIELYPDKTPGTVRNFLRYVDAGFYDGTIFHRVIPRFLIQGGGWTSPTELKKEGLQNAIQSEARIGFGKGLRNVRGAVAMARARSTASATSQFFINVEDNLKLDYPDGDGAGYCVFGQVVEGQDVVDHIQSVPTQRNPLASSDRTPSLPITPPMIRSAFRLGNGPTSAPARLGTPESQPQPPAPPPEEYNQPAGPEQPPEPETPEKSVAK